VRSPIDDQFRPTGRSTMGVKFVTPKNGDSVAVVARSVEKDAEVEEAVEIAVEEAEAEASTEPADDSDAGADIGSAEATDGSNGAEDSATIEPEDDGSDPAPEEG
jgi:DNA gyrase subunit A